MRMRQVTRFRLKDFTDRDFASLYGRSVLLKLRRICVFEIDEDFNKKLAFTLKAYISYLKSKKKIVCLDVRDANNHELLLELLPYVVAVKVKYEYLSDHEKLLELLEKSSTIPVPVMLYFKTDNLHDFINLYSTSTWHYTNLFKVIDIGKVNPLSITRAINDKSIFLLDCPLCVSNKLGVRSCTSGVLDIYMNVYKTGKKLKFEEVSQVKEADFFKKSSFCKNCICGGRCLGNRLDTVAPSLPGMKECTPLLLIFLNNITWIERIKRQIVRYTISRQSMHPEASSFLKQNLLLSAALAHLTQQVSLDREQYTGHLSVHLPC